MPIICGFWVFSIYQIINPTNQRLMNKEIIKKERARYLKKLEELQDQASERIGRKSLFGGIMTYGDTDEWRRKYTENRIMSNILLIMLRALE